MREVNLDGYKYLGVLQLVPILKRYMKGQVKTEYIRTVKILLRSQLNGENIIAEMNAWAVGSIRYGSRVLDWTKEKLKSIDIKTRKLMTMNASLHQRENVGKLYLAIKEGGKGLMIYQECVNVEVQILDKDLSDSKEWMSKFVSGEKELSEVKAPNAFKKRLKMEKTSQ